MSLPKVLQKIINNVGYGQALTGNDNDIVHKTGNEEISGIKTFDRVTINGSNWTPVRMKVADNFDTNVPTYPSVNSYAGIEFTDGTGNATGSMYQNFTTSGTRVLRFRNTGDNGAALSCLEIGYDPSTGEQWAACPSTLASRSSYGGDIVTRNWIPQDTRIVHTTGEEDVQGIKWFDNIRIKLRNDTKGTLPSASRYYNLNFVDQNDSHMGGVQYSYLTNGSSYIRFGASKYNTDDFAGIYTGFDSDGYAYAMAPSTSSSRSNGLDIVTRDWIPQDTRIVHTTGNENIAGVKTFTDQNVYINSASGPRLNLKDANASITGSSIVWTEIKSLDGSDNTPAYIALGSSSSSTGKVAGGLISFYVHQANVNAGGGNYVISFMTSSSNNWLLPSDGVICLGGGANRWKQIYSNNTTISTSDERLKNSVDKISDDVLDAWDDISWSQFKFNESVKEKGNNARLHTGLIAQDVDRKFKQHNLNVADYGLFCYDEWEDSPEIHNDNGELIREAVIAGNRYSIRYEEALCMEAAYNRRRVSRLEEKIKLLEQKLNLAS